jgi:hypothetical protein
MARTRRHEVERPTAAGGLMRLQGTGFGEAFRRRQPVEFGHALADHPLLTLDGIADLADALPRARSSTTLRTRRCSSPKEGHPVACSTGPAT